MLRWVLGWAAVAALMCAVGQWGCAEGDDAPTDAPVSRSADASQNSRGAGSRERLDLPSDLPGRVHVVHPNETLYSLAERYYGHGKHWRKIYLANRNRISDPTDLSVGMKLIIP